MVPQAPYTRITPARAARCLDSHRGLCAFSPAMGRASRLTAMYGFYVGNGTCAEGRA